uniref:Uncharacterized protein n=1 Tax=Strongyloides papillosus TaxID=174720 RepID=A0A0N5CGK8_STREA
MPTTKRHTKVQEKGHEDDVVEVPINLEEETIEKLKNVIITEKRHYQRLEDIQYYKNLGEKYYNLYLDILSERQKRYEIERLFVEESIDMMIDIINKKIETIQEYNNHEKETNLFLKLDDNSFVDYESSLEVAKEKISNIHDIFISDYTKAIGTFEDYLENLKFDEDVIETEYWQKIHKRFEELQASMDDERKQLEKEKLKLEESISALNIKIEKEEIRQLARRKVLESQRAKLLEELDSLSSSN